MYAPSVYIREPFCGVVAVGIGDVLHDPGDQMILEGALDHLVEEIEGKELVDVGTREVDGKWLYRAGISTRAGL